MGDTGAQQPLPELWLKPDIPFECIPTGTDQVITRFLPSCVDSGRPDDLPDLGHNLLGNLLLRMRRTPGEILDGVAVTVTGQKIHRRIAFVGAQALVNQTHALDELGPVECGNGAHAGDDVASRQVVGDLVGVFTMHDFIKADTFPVQPFIEEIERVSGPWMRVVQALQDLDRERLPQRGGRQYSHRKRQIGFVGLIGCLFDLINKPIRLTAPGLGSHDADRQPTQIFD